MPHAYSEGNGRKGWDGWLLPKNMNVHNLVANHYYQKREAARAVTELPYAKMNMLMTFLKWLVVNVFGKDCSLWGGGRGGVSKGGTIIILYLVAFL